MRNVRILVDPHIGISVADPYQQFCQLRSEVVEAFRKWAETKPPDDHLADELNGTVGALWGVAATVAAAYPKGTVQ